MAVMMATLIKTDISATPLWLGLSNCSCGTGVGALVGLLQLWLTQTWNQQPDSALLAKLYG